MKKILMIHLFIAMIFISGCDCDEDTAVENSGPMRVGDRWYVYHKLIDIFGESVEDNLKEKVIPYASFFGGSCSLYEAVPEGTTGAIITTNGNDKGKYEFKFTEGSSIKRCYAQADITTALTLKSSVARQGLMAQVCYDIVKPDESATTAGVSKVLEEICTNPDTCSFSLTEVEKAYQLFYPYIDLSTDEASGLQVATTQGVEGVEYSDGNTPMKHLLYALCVDPNWQQF